MKEKIFTVCEAASQTSMSESWWRQRIHRKEIRYCKIGNRVLIPESTIEDVITVIEPRPGSKYCRERLS
jgi:excisionase family DNA binding protein